MRKSLLTKAPSRRLVLQAETALDLMVPHPLCLLAAMTIKEAAAALTAARITGAAVLDEAGRAVGVLSQTDIVRHGCGSGVPGAPGPAAAGEPPPRPRARRQAGGRVADIMTPAVFSVRPRTPAETVVDSLLSMEVHRLFVTDDAGTVIGVITGRDILRHLGREGGDEEVFPG
jgi:CBS-domain-containing membrane protein